MGRAGCPQPAAERASEVVRSSARRVGDNAPYVGRRAWKWVGRVVPNPPPNELRRSSDHPRGALGTTRPTRPACLKMGRAGCPQPAAGRASEVARSSARRVEDNAPYRGRRAGKWVGRVVPNPPPDELRRSPGHPRGALGTTRPTRPTCLEMGRSGCPQPAGRASEVARSSARRVGDNAPYLGRRAWKWMGRVVPNPPRDAVYSSSLP
jgi:hypothetical protein